MGARAKGLPELLTGLGVNGGLCGAAAGSQRRAVGSTGIRRATHRWLQQHSGLDELRGVDFETVGVMQLYRASDAW